MNSLVKEEAGTTPAISDNLKQKIFSAIVTIKEFYLMNEGRIHVSYSGGLDSSVLLHIARSVYPKIKAVHLDTMQEYKGIKELVRSVDNVTIIKPSMTFTQIVNTYGYPLVSKNIARMIYDRQHPTDKNKKTRDLNDCRTFTDKKGIVRNNTFYLSDKHRYLLEANIPISHKCCLITKERPLIDYRKQNKEGALIGMLEEESRTRKKALESPCINTKKNVANPFKDWTKQDIFEYIVTFNLKYATEYGLIYFDEKENKYKTTGLDRTGCKGCLFGANKEEAIKRMELLKETDIKSYKAFMLGGKTDNKGFLRPYKGFGYKKIIDILK